MFRDRKHAGQLLAAKVEQCLGEQGSLDAEKLVVIGLPRGGVPIAKEVAAALGAPLTVLVSKKIGAPGQPEFAIGAVSSKGVILVNESLLPLRGKWLRYIESEKHRLQRATNLLEQHLLQQAHLQPANLKGAIALVVDDGIATGMTACAAVRSVRAAGADKVFLAAPVVAAQILAALETECDGVIAVEIPADLNAIGCFYNQFEQVEEDRVVQDLIDGNRATIAN